MTESIAGSISKPSYAILTFSERFFPAAIQKKVLFAVRRTKCLAPAGTTEFGLDVLAETEPHLYQHEKGKRREAEIKRKKTCLFVSKKKN